MNIVNFTPQTGLAGGLLIGLSALLMMLLSGRIAGVSGVLGGVLTKLNQGDRLWRWTFLAGLLIGGLVYELITAKPLVLTGMPGLPRVVLAGLFVGIGTRMGNGCTSGHGVCGLALFSKRSLVATLSFMAAGVVTVTVLRHLV